MRPVNLTPQSAAVFTFDEAHGADGPGITIRTYVAGALAAEYILYPDGARRGCDLNNVMEEPPRDYYTRRDRVLQYYEELVRRAEKRFNDTKEFAQLQISRGLGSGMEAMELKKLHAAVMDARKTLADKRQELEAAKPPELIEQEEWQAKQHDEERARRAQLTDQVNSIRI